MPKLKGRIGIEIIGQNSERFRIEKLLGAGSFGEVYKAVGTTSGTVVAVKLAPKQKLNDPLTLSLRTVLNEVRMALLEVSHPNVIRMLYVDTGSDADIGPYVMMEYVEGGTLQKLLDDRLAESKHFTLEEALGLMRGIALGAQAINEHLIHRDIKPDNILLDGSPALPRPRIADFGIAKKTVDSTRPETFKGIQAFRYMAPEVWRDERNTPKIDVYSVGLVFYQILTLEHPLFSFVVDPFDVIKWRDVHLSTPCSDVRASRSDVPQSIAKLLLRMTDKSPGNRPDWDEVLRTLTIKEMPSAPSVPIDPQLIAVMKRQADERLREEHAKTAAQLERQKEAERHQSQGEEYKQSALRLLTKFDEIIGTLNQHDTAYPINIDGEGTLRRSYGLPNYRSIECELFPYHGRLLRSRQYYLLGGGYLGISGSLSMNLLLTGQPDDIAAASWVAVEANVHALISGEAQLKWMREAQLSEETMKFLLFYEADQVWRRECPTFFGFPNASLFYERFEVGQTAMDVYSFNTRPDVMKAFNDLLKLGFSMPKKRL